MSKSAMYNYLNKKGEIAWDKIGVWILALILIIILLVLVLGHKETLIGLLNDIENVLRFGGR